MKRSPSVNSLARSLAFSPSSTRARTYATEVHQHHHHQLWQPLQQLPIELLTPPDRSPSLHHLNTYEPATLKSRHDWRLTAYSRQRALSNPPSWLRPMRVPASKTIRSRHDGEQGAAIDLYSNRCVRLAVLRPACIQTSAQMATDAPLGDGKRQSKGDSASSTRYYISDASRPLRCIAASAEIERRDRGSLHSLERVRAGPLHQKNALVRSVLPSSKLRLTGSAVPNARSSWLLAT